VGARDETVSHRSLWEGEESKYLVINWSPMRPRRFLELEAARMGNYYVVDSSETVLN